MSNITPNSTISLMRSTEVTPVLLPTVAEKEKITDKEAKVIIFGIDHMSIGPKKWFVFGHLRVEHMAFTDFFCNYRHYAIGKMKEGYSVLFHHEGKVKILKYNT